MTAPTAVLPMTVSLQMLPNPKAKPEDEQTFHYIYFEDFEGSPVPDIEGIVLSTFESSKGACSRNKIEITRPTKTSLKIEIKEASRATVANSIVMEFLLHSDLGQSRLADLLIGMGMMRAS
jgi:hypothetical protein